MPTKLANYNFTSDLYGEEMSAKPSLVLLLERSKCLITLQGSGVKQELDYGASEFVKEDVNQNVIMFGVAGVNGDYVQVTGTDSKRISWSGMFYSANAVTEKEYLEGILKEGNPMSFHAFYHGGGSAKVIIQSASFEIRKECYITYNITLVEYKQITYSAIKKDFWTDIPSNTGGGTTPEGAQEKMKEDMCADSIIFHCENLEEKDFDEVSLGKIISLAESTPNTCISELDVASCNPNWEESEKARNTVNQLLNYICKRFAGWMKASTYFMHGDTKIPLQDGLQCIMGSGGPAFENALINYLLSSCFSASFVKNVKIFERNALGVICLTDEFIALLPLLLCASGGSGIGIVIFLIHMPKIAKSIEDKDFIEISEECAKSCLSNYDELINEATGNKENTTPEETGLFSVTRTIIQEKSPAKIEVKVKANKDIAEPYIMTVSLTDDSNADVWVGDSENISVGSSLTSWKWIIEENATATPPFTLTRGDTYYVSVYIWDATSTTLRVKMLIPTILVAQ